MLSLMQEVTFAICHMPPEPWRALVLKPWPKLEEKICKEKACCHLRKFLFCSFYERYWNFWTGASSSSSSTCFLLRLHQQQLFHGFVTTKRKPRSQDWKERLSSTLGATDDEFPDMILERSSCRARLISIPLLRIVIRLRAVLQLSRENSLNPPDRCRRRTGWETGSIQRPQPARRATAQRLVPRKSDIGASRLRWRWGLHDLIRRAGGRSPR